MTAGSAWLEAKYMRAIIPMLCLSHKPLLPLMTAILKEA